MVHCSVYGQFSGCVSFDGLWFWQSWRLRAEENWACSTDREWEWILHRLYKQSLHNMYFDSVCFMFVTFEEGLMNPFKILVLKGGRCHFMACDLRRRRQLFLQALVWQLPSLWLDSFSSFYKNLEDIKVRFDENCLWNMN